MILSAMAGDHERSTGPWQSERIALPQIFELASAAFAQTLAIAEGMTVDTERMRRNLDATGGLITSEAVAMALAERIGKRRAHDLVEHACEEAIESRRPIGEVLLENADVALEFDAGQVAELLDPRRYVGESGEVVDRVLAMADSI
jgi:3-carboxy-cis,cis-muconate cycloisomerase